MRLTTKNILSLGFITLCGLLCSGVLGLLRYGGDLFDPMSPGFAFLSFGLSGAFIFAFYHVRGLSETITIAVIVSTIQFVIGLTWITILNAAIWSFGVNLPVVVLAFLFERKLASLRRARFLFVAAMYGAGFVVLSLIAGWLVGLEHMPAMAFRENFIDGVLLGLGIGLGIELGEALSDSVLHYSSPGPAVIR